MSSNSIQQNVTAAVAAIAGPAWAVNWTSVGVRLDGMARWNKRRSVRIVFDDPTRCEGARFVGQAGGGCNPKEWVLAAIAAVEPEHARALIAQEQDEDTRLELLARVFGE